MPRNIHNLTLDLSTISNGKTVYPTTSPPHPQPR